jgi:hypothetical protein
MYDLLGSLLLKAATELMPFYLKQQPRQSGIHREKNEGKHQVRANPVEIKVLLF